MKDLIELRAAVVADRSGMWNALGVLECTERILAEKDARIAELERLTDAIDEERRGALDLCVQRNKELTASRAECEGLRAALEALMSAETVSVHVGYDDGPGGGNFVYADAVRTDDDAFSLARAALSQKEPGHAA